MEERKKIAKWLYDKIMAEDYTEQETIVYEINELFGDKYTYLNKNDNLAIDLGVLKEFGKLKKDDIEWDRSVKAWSKKEKK